MKLRKIRDTRQYLTRVTQITGGKSCRTDQVSCRGSVVCSQWPHLAPAYCVVVDNCLRSWLSPLSGHTTVAYNHQQLVNKKELSFNHKNLLGHNSLYFLNIKTMLVVMFAEWHGHVWPPHCSSYQSTLHWLHLLHWQHWQHWLHWLHLLHWLHWLHWLPWQFYI